MLIKSIEYTSKFMRSLKRLSPSDKQNFLKQEKIFKNNCFDTRLKTHKLSGKYQNYWSFSINYAQRVMFEIIGEYKVRFINVGDHNIYK